MPAILITEPTVSYAELAVSSIAVAKTIALLVFSVPRERDQGRVA